MSITKTEWDYHCKIALTVGAIYERPSGMPSLGGVPFLALASNFAATKSLNASSKLSEGN